jgi:hypothetical protein
MEKLMGEHGGVLDKLGDSLSKLAFGLEYVSFLC